MNNIRGLTEKVIEYVPEGLNIETAYRYNPMKEIITVFDNQNNMTFANYEKWLPIFDKLVNS